MQERNDHQAADLGQPERFLAWVCSDLSCPEWGAFDDRPRLCMHGHPTRETPLRLLARKDVRL